MKKRSSKLKKILIAVLILATLIGGMFGARAYISSGKTAAVIPVSMIADTWIEDSSAGYGQVSQGGIQYIYPDTSMLIQKVYVSPGDVVNKGDPLIQYDATQAVLQVDSYRIQYEMTKRDYAEAKETLAYYKTFKPYQEPKPDFKVYKKTVKIYWNNNNEFICKGDSISGKGTKDKKYVINVNLDTPISIRTFQYLLGYNSNNEALFSDEESNAEGEHVYFTFVIWESALGQSSVKIAEVSSKAGNKPANLKAWFERVEKENNTFCFNQLFSVDSQFSGDVTPLKDTEVYMHTDKVVKINQLTSSAVPDPVEIPEEESHTQEEIDEMILNQTQTIRRMEVSVAQAELAWKRAKQTATDGVVRAYDEGTVTSVGDPFAVSGDEPFITVQSGHGYEITSTISELQLGTVKVGDQVSIQMWSNGMTYTGTITKISPYPTTNNMSYYGGGGGNVSYYEYNAALDCEDELQPWDGGEIRFVTDSSSSKAEFALQTCYVREENGRSYVLKAGDDDRLVKQYVEVGRLLYGGYSVEILGGLSLEDSIAFPYGKSAVEGAKVDRESGMGGMYW